MPQLLLVEVESRILPVVEKSEPVAHAILQLIAACPVVKIPLCRLCAVVAECEHKLGSGEHLAALQLIVGGIGIDGGNEAQHTHIVHLESTGEIACPTDGTEQCLARVGRSLCVESQLEEGMALHGGTRTELGVDHLLAKLQFLCGGICLACPVAVVVGEEIPLCLKIDHGTGISPERDGATLLMADFTPGLYDVLLVIGYVM